MRFQTRRDTRITILYSIVFIATLVALYVLIKGIVINPLNRDVFLDVIAIVFVIFIAFMALSVYLVNYFEFDLEANEICSKAGLGYMERYKFKYVLSYERKKKFFATSALSVDVLEIVVERDKKEGKIVLYASPKDEQGFIAALRSNCRNIKFIDKKR